MDILITGANRGIGAEFVRQYLDSGNRVIATYRTDKGDLEALEDTSRNQLIPVQIDIANESAGKKLLEALPTGSVDLLINNAGIYPKADPSASSSHAEWLDGFTINCISPLVLSYQLLPALKRGSKKGIVFLSSKMGSIADNTSGGSYLYRASKAALNAAVKSLAIDLKEERVPVLILHPGWVRTDMGGPHALITPVKSVSGMREVIGRLSLQGSGCFLAYDGTPVPW